MCELVVCVERFEQDAKDSWVQLGYRGVGSALTLETSVVSFRRSKDGIMALFQRKERFISLEISSSGVSATVGPVSGSVTAGANPGS
ncbi:hypothetical protein WICPIJ_000742 [Wickerhamomyces pijperi]|uniref:Uncharacterized protein n=1 Tax=Wickerhamomyces pijperi TaxID=599730 RepID=A0A9P8QD71_WICPI|nr:hypothetical protein WICPIJ_000742 [Wickerhamomyces pijperi]